MQVLDKDQTAALLPYRELAESIRNILAIKKAGVTIAPERLVVDLETGATLMIMPASDTALAVIKTVTVHPANANTDLPTVQADVLVLDAVNGRRLGLLQGNMVTARRTAALSLLAASLLAPDNKGPLLMIGSGVQARAHLEAFVEAHGVKRVCVHSRTLPHAQRLADDAKSLGCDARAVDKPDEALAEATLIVTATSSKTPILPDKVRDDAFIAAIGSYIPEMAELPPSLIARSRVYVDTLEGARSEAGDLIQAGIDWDRVTALEDAFDQPPAEPGPIVFKSVGHALFDLAAARLLFQPGS